MNGQIVIPYHLLKEINISIPHHLFVSLKQDKKYKNLMEKARVISLLLIIEKCRNRTVFDSLGGTFFKKLIEDHNPSIALYVYYFLFNTINSYASKFLVKQLSQTSSEYFVYLKKLISKAQKYDQQQLLENPYFQLIEQI